MVGRRGEAPLVPPYILPSIQKCIGLGIRTTLADRFDDWSSGSANSDH